MDGAKPKKPGTRTTDDGGPVAGDHYLSLIADQLQEERRSKHSLEQRGVAVVTTSGALSALLFGFAALASRSGGLGPWPSFLVAESLVLFVAAAVQGLRIQGPAAYAEVKLASLQKVLRQSYWEGPTRIGSRRSGEIQVQLIETARVVNDGKGKALRLAIRLELLAVVLLTSAIILALAKS